MVGKAAADTAVGMVADSCYKCMDWASGNLAGIAWADKAAAMNGRHCCSYPDAALESKDDKETT